MRELGPVVREARVSAGWSIRALAEKLHISAGYLADIENDRRIPSEDVLHRIADTLSLDFEDLAATAGQIGLAGRVLLRRSPEAVRLVRICATLGDEAIGRLRKAAERAALKAEAERGTR